MRRACHSPSTPPAVRAGRTACAVARGRSPRGSGAGRGGPLASRHGMTRPRLAATLLAAVAVASAVCPRGRRGPGPAPRERPARRGLLADRRGEGRQGLPPREAPRHRAGRRGRAPRVARARAPRAARLPEPPALAEAPQAEPHPRAGGRLPRRVPAPRPARAGRPRLHPPRHMGRGGRDPLDALRRRQRSRPCAGGRRRARHAARGRLAPRAHLDGGTATHAVYRFYLDLAGSFPAWMGKGQAASDVPELFANITKQLPAVPVTGAGASAPPARPARGPHLLRGPDGARAHSSRWRSVRVQSSL